MAIEKCASKFEHPLDGDMLMAKADTPDRDLPPAELNDTHNYFVMSNIAQSSFTHKREDIAITRVEGYADVYSANGSIVLGHIPEKLVAVEVHKMLDSEAKDAEPHIPKWSGISYAPRSASLVTRRQYLRRRSVASVTSHT